MLEEMEAKLVNGIGSLEPDSILVCDSYVHACCASMGRRDAGVAQNRIDFLRRDGLPGLRCHYPQDHDKHVEAINAAIAYCQAVIDA